MLKSTEKAVLSGQHDGRFVGVKKLPVLDKSPNSAIKYIKEEALWVAAMERDDVALSYFAARRMELDTKGFTVFHGFCNEEELPKSSTFNKGLPRKAKDVVPKLSEHFIRFFPGEDALQSEDMRTIWNPIFNAGARDEKDREKGIGRFITTNLGVTKWEEMPNLVWAAEKRALLDLRIGAIAAAMRLGKEKQGEDAMTIPVSGGRFLYTGKGCPRQVLHTDFEVNRRRDPNKLPGYFAVCTTGIESPLWVVPGSHLFLRRSSEAMRKIAEGVTVIKIVIPPWSILFGRGDLAHAGPGFDDYDVGVLEDGAIRYHIYFQPPQLDLIDGVHFVKEFNPRFKSEPEEYDSSEVEDSDEEDEEDEEDDMDAEEEPTDETSND